jgi:hypothetical protein
MLGGRMKKKTVAKAALSAASFAFARRYPKSRLTVALPIVQAAFYLYEARERERRRHPPGPLERLRRLR